MKKEKKLLKWGFYLRVSSVEQAMEREGSLKNQEDRLNTWLEHKKQTLFDHEVWEKHRTYIERGKSGGNTNRPEYQKMLQDIRDGIINAVVCVKLDRISRSLPDFYKLVELFSKYDVTFVSLRENFDTSSAQGRAFLKMTLILAEFERELTSERTSTNMRVRAERGLWNGGILLGYDLNPDKKGYLVVNEREAEVVKLAFEYYLEAGSVLKSAGMLNDRNYRPKNYTSRRGLNHSPEKFSYSSVKLLLKNCAYIGLKEINKKKASFPQDELPENERYKTVEACWEPIIDKKIFDDVQKLLAENGEKKQNVKKKTRHVYILSGLLRCNHCDSLLEGWSSTGRSKTYFYYGHKGSKKKTGCPLPRVTAEQVEKIVIEQVKNIAADSRLITELVTKTNNELNATLPRLQERKKLLEEEKVETRKKAMALVDKLASDPNFELNGFVKDQLNGYEIRTKDIDNEVLLIEDDLSSLENERISAELVQETLQDFFSVFDDQDVQKQKDMIRLVVKSIDLSPDEIKIALFGKHPDTGPSGGTSAGERWCVQTAYWLLGTDSNRRQGG